MPRATPFVRQWAGLVAQVGLFGAQAGRPSYERLGFATAGELQLYEQPLGPA